MGAVGNTAHRCYGAWDGASGLSRGFLSDSCVSTQFCIRNVLQLVGSSKQASIPARNRSLNKVMSKSFPSAKVPQLGGTLAPYLPGSSAGEREPSSGRQQAHRKPSLASRRAPCGLCVWTYRYHQGAKGLIIGGMWTTWVSNYQRSEASSYLLQVGQWLSLGLSGKGRHPRRTRSNVPFQRGLSLGPRGRAVSSCGGRHVRSVSYLWAIPVGTKGGLDVHEG